MSDPRNIATGLPLRLPEGAAYADQPYVAVNDDGSWTCVVTTGPGEEGDRRQSVVALRTEDRGRTWSAPVPLEPRVPPEASWAVPVRTPAGRVYVFYNHNTDDVREVATDIGTTKRVDTLGRYVFRYSDDGGRTWSADRYEVPVRAFAIDRENPYAGRLRFFWSVCKPLVHRGSVYVGLAKVGRFGQGFMARSEGVVLRSDNLLTEHDPARARWETLPDGDVGLRAPEGGPVADEHNLVALPDGALFCVCRTTLGSPAQFVSRDGGRTWTPPAFMTYGPGSGRRVKHPRAANFVRRMANGKYLYWFHNHGGKGYEGRNPVWIMGGVAPRSGGAIRWAEPEVLLYDDDPAARISYPDFVETADGRVYVTETQKRVARVHEIDRSLLEGLWAQAQNRRVAPGAVEARDGDAPPDALRAAMDLERRGGFSLEVVVRPGASAAEPGATLLAWGGGSLTAADCGALRLTLRDARGGEFTCETDAGLLSPGRPLHLVATVDAGPRVVTFVADGRLCDGGEERPQGWHRFPASLGDVGGGAAGALRVSADVSLARAYARPLRTSEAVGNCRAAAARAVRPGTGTPGRR